MKIIVRAALVAAVIAVLVGSGAATAASNLVTGKQIAKHTITARNIKRSAITGTEIKNGSVSSGDLTDGAIETLSGAKGPAGPQGPAGPAGTVVTVAGPHQLIPPGGASSGLRADCPPGTVVVGTGVNTGIGNADFVLSFGTFVGGFVDNDVSINIEAYVQAICASGLGGGGGSSRSVPSKAAAEQAFKSAETSARANR